MENKKPRADYWDNVKGLLILLVVYGHLIEQLPGGKNSAVYKLIYLFHMPLFVFCSGYLSRFSPEKILKRLLLPYVLLQAVCCIITVQEIQMTTPYWALWYLPALAVWRITIPFLESCSQKAAPLVIAAALLCACLFGFDNTVGYYATLSRMIVFYPYFIAGYYARKYGYHPRTPKQADRVFPALVLLSAAGIFLFFSSYFEADWLYEAYSYRGGNYNIFFRAAHYFMAAAIGSSILFLMPKKRTIFTAWGYNSFPIYLTHIAITPAVQMIFSFRRTGRLFSYTACALLSAVYCTAVARKKVSGKASG